MKLLEINDASIAHIFNTDKFCAEDINNGKKDLIYEWFYFEITQNDSRIVLIISIKDAFYEKYNSSNPASIYFTWHISNKLVAYSYSLFEGKYCASLLNKLKQLFYGDNEYLDLLLPDFSFQKYIQLKIKLNAHQKHQTNHTDDLRICSNKNHFWQFITNSECIEGSVETRFVPEFKMKEYYHRASSFYDDILKTKLKKTPLHSIVFNSARAYLDHNFGYESLSKIKPWYWWHSETSGYSDVTYFFPHTNKAFFYSSHCVEPVVETYSKNELFIGNKTHLFGFLLPKKIISKFFGTLDVGQVVESAPFYLRTKLFNFECSTKQATGTFEILIPKRIKRIWNRILMSARIIKSKGPLLNKTNLDVDLSFEEICKQITKIHGKSFFFASKILSGNDRNNAYFIYALCRLIDDSTDVKHDTNQSQLVAHDTHKSNSIKSESIFSELLIQILWSYSNHENDQNFNFQFINELKEKISQSVNVDISNNSAKNFIQSAIEKIKILQLEKKLFDELVAGQRMDENFVQPKTYQEFYRYCFCVAGVVGLMMAKIFSAKNNEKSFEAAEHLGIAMQITNILRDIKEDFEMDRVYIPKEYCDKYDLRFSSELFTNNEYNHSKISIIKEFSNYALCYYMSALNGVSFIPKIRYRFCVRLMCAIYAGILNKIILNPLVVFKQRVFVTQLQKIWIFIKVLIGFHPLSAAGIKQNFDRNFLKDKNL